MQPRFTRSIVIAVAAAGTGSLFAQSVATTHKSAKSQDTYEDREIRVVIPAGWKVVADAALKRPDGPGMSLGNSISDARRKLILEKQRYGHCRSFGGKLRDLPPGWGKPSQKQ